MAAGLAGTSLELLPQSVGKVHRIAYLGVGNGVGPLQEAFVRGLRERDYVVGRNLALEYRWAGGDMHRLPALAEEIVRLDPDVIVGSSTSVIRALMRATRSIPIVMAASADPVATGIAASLARPGGNVTGMTLLSNELANKRFQLVREIVPRAKRVAMLSVQTPAVLRMSPGQNTSELLATEMQAVAGQMKIDLATELIEKVEDLPHAFAALRRERPEALMVQLAPLTFEHRATIVKMAAEQRLPDMYEIRPFAEAGGLVSYGPDLAEMFRRAATFVDRILRGASAGDLAIEQPSRFELVVNAKTAKMLGIAIPQALLVRADAVIR